MTKIVIVGAGSVVFTRNLLADFFAYPELRGGTVGLHDVDADRLRTAQRIAEWTAAHFGASPEIQASLDRRDVLPDADFVVNAIQVGGIAATRVDFDVPARYGIQYTIADTVGAGGVMRGLRTIPVVLEIARQMEELCPAAWLLNYTNPMSMLVWAASRATGIRTLGLCHSVYWTIHRLAGWLSVPFAEVRAETAGINHIAWVLTLRHGGQDLYPRLRSLVERGDIPPGDRVRAELFRRLGYFPTESSEHHAEYSPFFLAHPELVETLRIPLREYVRRCESNLAEYDETKRRLDRGEELAVEPTSEYAAEIIHCLLTGERTEIVGNVMNQGRLIPNLQAESCVEVPCLVNGTGVHPVMAGALPTQCAALIHPLIDQQALTVQAALEEDRQAVYHAMMLDPVLAGRLTLDEIWSMADELIEAEGQWLPPWLRA
ncbi:MAG TPA: alpha-glucosidase/alpha-galactosidase [Chloroflexota bacterium]|nr:alpha-glucosidase/alpha-galactosidase [Chloroflexota bacterium]